MSGRCGFGFAASILCQSGGFALAALARQLLPRARQQVAIVVKLDFTAAAFVHHIHGDAFDFGERID